MDTADTNAAEPAIKRRRTPQEISDLLKEKAKARDSGKSEYIDLSWLPATSVMVERLFSKLKCTLGYLRRSMNKDTLEALIHLQLNWDLLTDNVVSLTIEKAKEEEDDEEDDDDVDAY